MGSSLNTCVGGDICIDMAGFVGQITVTGCCCLNSDEMIAHTFDASGIGKLSSGCVLVVSSCRWSISHEFLVYKAATHEGGFVSGCSRVVSGQNCPFASLHNLNCSSGISIALVLL